MLSYGKTDGSKVQVVEAEKKKDSNSKSHQSKNSTITVNNIYNSEFADNHLKMNDSQVKKGGDDTPQFNGMSISNRTSYSNVQAKNSHLQKSKDESSAAHDASHEDDNGFIVDFVNQLMENFE